MTLLLVALIAVGFLVIRRAWKRRHGPRNPVRRRRGALLVVGLVLGCQALIGSPALGQVFSCKEEPNPERPGSGMVGAIDPAPIGAGESGSAYDEFGYSGLVWHTYDLGCGPQGVTNPNALVDTWLGNELFNIGKNLVGATNGLHYALLTGDLLKPLDDGIKTGTAALYDSVFGPWFGVAALLLAVLLFRYIWMGDLATIGKRSMWALAALWFASATYLTPLVYTHALDDVVLTGTSAVQAGFLEEVGVDERDALPTMLHDQVVYRNWARGEFGTPDAPQANQLGMDLLRAQSWTKEEVATGADAGPNANESKKAAFRDVAAKMEASGAYGYFQGVDGSRVGAGLMAMLQGGAYASFQLLAKATILLAQVLLRVLILAGPLIGLVALIYHQILRSIGRVAGAAMLNVVLISAMAGIHTLALTWIFNPVNHFSVLTQMVLAGLITIVFLMVGKPLRRMGQMVELSVGRVGGIGSKMPTSVFSRFRRGSGDQPSPGDQFWDQVRDGESEEAGPRQERARSRPEATAGTLSATAQRMDRGGEGAGPDSGASAGALALPSPGARPGTARSAAQSVAAHSAASLPEGRSSRVVDTAPVADARWDRFEEDPVLVPSQKQAPAEPDAAPRTETTFSRRSEMEVVSGRPVNIVYRPSRGLEVADGG